jgi:hypothetical protein
MSVTGTLVPLAHTQVLKHILSAVHEQDSSAAAGGAGRTRDMANTPARARLTIVRDGDLIGPPSVGVQEDMDTFATVRRLRWACLGGGTLVAQ